MTAIGGEKGSVPFVRTALTFVLLLAAMPLGARSVETPPVGCSWPAKIDADTLNFAYPDESATYWVTRFVSIPGAHLEIHGTYPDARYFSFHAYDELQRPVGSLADFEIAPDAGSLNPFVTPGTPPGGAFTRRTSRSPGSPRHRRRTRFTPAPPRTAFRTRRGSSSCASTRPTTRAIPPADSRCR